MCLFVAIFEKIGCPDKYIPFMGYWSTAQQNAVYAFRQIYKDTECNGWTLRSITAMKNSISDMSRMS